MLDRLGGLKTAALSTAVGVLAAPLAMAGAPTVTSTFDSDLEGWSAVGFDIDFTVIPPSFTLTEVANTPDMVHDAGGGAFDGNPGGFARFTDVIEEPSSFANAPGDYLGDLSGYLGGTFSFEHRLFDEGSEAEGVAPYAIIFVSGDVNDLNAFGAVLPGPGLGDADTGWVTVSANLTDGGPGGLIPVSDIDLGVFDPSLDGLTAGGFGFSGDATFEEVMADVTQVLVAFELVDNNSTQTSESGGIDNVRLEAIPEPGSAALLGLAGLALLRRRRV
ncbi:PEP-CTERM sorting domain-containing protein [Phycisphaeraceae bacterium D3-23]